MHTIQSIYLYIHNLQDANYFFAVFLLTIIIIRLSLLPKKRIVSPKLGDMHVHHYIYGILIIIIAFLFPSITLYAAGLGFFVDELPLFGIEQWLFSHEDWHWGVYHSPKSMMILLFSIFLVYLFRYNLLMLLPHTVLL